MAILSSVYAFSEEQGYAVFDSATGTLTFKYGEKPEGDNVFDTDNTPIDDDSPFDWFNMSWYTKRGDVKKVVFEESFENARPVSTRCWFANFFELEEIVGLNHINSSNLVTMERMFDCCSSLQSLDLTGLKTDHVTNMSSLFEHCTDLTSLDVSGFNTECVTNMSSMFASCQAIVSIDLSGFKTDNVTDMSNMFNSCSNLQEANLSSVNTKNVTDMSHMFAFCNFKELDLRCFNTENVTTMDGMFMGCTELEKLDLSSFRTNNLVDISNVFNSCKKLTSIDLSNFNTDNVTNMFALFAGCENLQNLNISSFNTDKVTNMCAMFSKCYSLKELDLHHFDTSNVSDMSEMFHYCSSITNIDLSKMDTRKLTKITRLFDHCSSLKEMDLTNFDTRNLTEYGYVFQACKNLEIVKFGEKFSTANVSGEYVNWGFQNCLRLKEIWIYGDVPEMIPTTFGRVGEYGSVILRVPEQYKKNYDAHFVDGYFYEGLFVLDVLLDNGGSTNPSNPTDSFTPNFETKFITNITRTDGKNTEVAELKYDDAGRISEYYIDGKLQNRYSYTGNTIKITEDGDSYTYNISDGKVTTSHTFLDGDYVDIDHSYTYNNDGQLVSIVSTEKESGSSYIYTSTSKWTWDGDNLSSWIGEDDEDTETSQYSYNNLTAEPIIRALFGFNPSLHLDDFYEIIAIYPYLGALPQNLFKNVIENDAEGRTWNYNYSYEHNSDGDISKVTITFKDHTYIYTLDWDYTNQSSDISVTKAGSPQKDVYYNLQGQRVDNPKRGLYILNGKKIIIK